MNLTALEFREKYKRFWIIGIRSNLPDINNLIQGDHAFSMTSTLDAYVAIMLHDENDVNLIRLMYNPREIYVMAYGGNA